MKKLLVGAVAALVAIGLLPVTAAWADVASDESTFVARINDLRAARGLAALRVDAGLTGKARAWALTMAAQNRIWHSALSDGISADWQKLGENVGMGGSVDGLHVAFVNSPGHYANLVDPVFDSIGIGAVRSGNTLFVAEEFMQSRAARATVAAPSMTPAPAKAVAAPTKTAGKAVKAVKAKAVKAKAVKTKAVKKAKVTKKARKAPRLKRR